MDVSYLEEEEVNYDPNQTFIIFHVKLQIPLIVTAISEMFWERNCRAKAMSNSTV